MDIASDQIAEFYRHQALILPYSSQHLGRTNLDIGCGTGLPSVIHHERLGIQPTLWDVVDMRHGSALAFPFFLFKNVTLPFRRKTFVSSSIQYVLHHVTTAPEVLRLLEEALRVSEKVIIVEEVTGAKTDVVRAELFDKRMNAQIAPEYADAPCTSTIPYKTSSVSFLT